jgi:hypothetical protein
MDLRLPFHYILCHCGVKGPLHRNQPISKRVSFDSFFLPSHAFFPTLHFSLYFISVFLFSPNSLGRSQSLNHQSKVFYQRDGEKAMAESPDIGHEC